MVTDLPSDEIVPKIDGNLVRVSHHSSNNELRKIISQAVQNYDVEKQRFWSQEAVSRFDYRHETQRLLSQIELLRTAYVGGT